MGEIRPKKCEPRELTKDQLEGSGGGTAWRNLVAVLMPVWPDGSGREAERFRLEP